MKSIKNFHDVHNMITYSLTRSKRKTVAIYIRNGIVDVRAPLKMSKREIDMFVISKEKWIADKLMQSIYRVNARDWFTLEYGDTVILRGREVTITAQLTDTAWYDDDHFYIPPGLSPEQIKDSCIYLYNIIADIVLKEKTSFFAKMMLVEPAAIKINSAKARWGSCSAKKSINYSWRLIMADDDIIDYVIVHELAHLLEMNHSKKFWDIVKQILPDYKDRKIRLVELQNRLDLEDWKGTL